MEKTVLPALNTSLPIPASQIPLPLYISDPLSDLAPGSDRASEDRPLVGSISTDPLAADIDFGAGGRPYLQVREPSGPNATTIPLRTANLFLGELDNVPVGGEAESGLDDDNEIEAEDADHLALALLEYALIDTAPENTGEPQFNYREPHRPSTVQDLLDLSWNNLVVRQNLSQESAREV